MKRLLFVVALLFVCTEAYCQSAPATEPPKAIAAFGQAPQTPAPHWAESPAASLKGISGVVVDIPSLSMNDKCADVLTSAGITATQIKTDTELRLREAGVPVIDKGQFGSVVLRIRLAALKQEYSACYSCTVSILDKCLLFRDQTVLVPAAIWEQGGVFFVGDQKLETVRPSITDLVNEFVNDYLAANPKPAK